MRKKRNSEDSKRRSMSPYEEKFNGDTSARYLYIHIRHEKRKMMKMIEKKIFTTTLNELVLCFILAKPKCISI